MHDAKQWFNLDSIELLMLNAPRILAWTLVILFGRGVGSNMERDEPMEIAAAGSTTTTASHLPLLDFRPDLGRGRSGYKHLPRSLLTALLTS